MQTYTIGQLSESAQVPVSTIRFYERAGLLKPDYRTGGNYRAYSEGKLERLKFIRSAQAVGLSLQDVSQLLELTFLSEPPCDEVLGLMRRRLDDIRNRLKEMRNVERALARSLDRCCKGDAPDLCTDICRLKKADHASLNPARKKSTQSA